MSSRLGRVVTVALLLLALVLVGGHLLGQPILLSYVETGSMQPTLDPGDGFVAIPAWATGPPQPGDVVVYDAENLHGGGLVTHRVVDRTDAGLITRGDANTVTDQSSGEPPVQESQVVATALQVGGHVVVVPELGTLVIVLGGAVTGLQRQLATLFGTRSLLGAQGLSYFLFAVGMLAYLASVVAERDGPSRDRSRRAARSTGRLGAGTVVVALALVLVVLLTLGMTVPGGAHEFEIVSSENDAPGANVIGMGQTEPVGYRVPSNGPVPVVAFVEPTTEGLTVDQTRVYIPPSSTRTVTVEIRAPDETGVFQRSLVEHRYLAVLPTSVIEALYRVHPWLPILAIDLLFGVGFVGLGFGLIGTRPLRLRGDSADLLAVVDRWLR
jgi:signal peptidase